MSWTCARSLKYSSCCSLAEHRVKGHVRARDSFHNAGPDRPYLMCRSNRRAEGNLCRHVLHTNVWVLRATQSKRVGCVCQPTGEEYKAQRKYKRDTRTQRQQPSKDDDANTTTQHTTHNTQHKSRKAPTCCNGRQTRREWQTTRCSRKYHTDTAAARRRRTTRHQHRCTARCQGTSTNAVDGCDEPNDKRNKHKKAES